MKKEKQNIEKTEKARQDLGIQGKSLSGRPDRSLKKAAAKTSSDLISYFEGVGTSLRASAKWILFGILCGAVVGTIASVFAIAIRTGTQIRAAYPQVLFGLPAAGLVIVFAYHRMGFAKDGGTNTILEAIREGKDVPIQMAPLIFLGTVLTHMFGGSAGREGAALQIGGSIGHGLGNFLHFQKADKKRVIMCGMSAAFAALFAAGSVLFLISDIVLILNSFGKETRQSLRVTNISLYYLGQLFLALSLLFLK